MFEIAFNVVSASKFFATFKKERLRLSIAPTKGDLISVATFQLVVR